jgi:hypothetical protein
MPNAESQIFCLIIHPFEDAWYDYSNPRIKVMFVIAARNTLSQQGKAGDLMDNHGLFMHPLANMVSCTENSLHYPDGNSMTESVSG